MEQEIDQVGNMADNLVSAMQPSLRDRYLENPSILNKKLKNEGNRHYGHSALQYSAIMLSVIVLSVAFYILLC
jgi:hypothetical protein